jgi:hypothetical protein
MDLTVLKKKVSTYRSEGGKLRKVSDELLGELLAAWETWPDSAASFYAAIGVDHRKMASLMGKAKKLKREGRFPVEEFKEIKIDPTSMGSALMAAYSIELAWEQGKIIRFAEVSQLVDFLKKVA